MSKDNNVQDLLRDVANAIREKKGTTDLINPQNFSEEIRGIESGGDDNGWNASVELVDSSQYGPDAIKSLIINEGVKELTYRAIYYATKMTHLSLPSTLTTIASNAVAGAFELKSIVIPDNVITIGSDAFSSCRKIAEVRIPDAVISIGDSAFRYCYALKSVDIGTGITSIGQLGFANGGVTTVTIRATNPPSIYTNTFAPAPSVIYVPKDSVEAYKEATNWSDLASIIQPIAE